MIKYIIFNAKSSNTNIISNNYRLVITSKWSFVSGMNNVFYYSDTRHMSYLAFITATSICSKAHFGYSSR